EIPGTGAANLEKIYLELENVDFNDKGKKIHPFLKSALDYTFTNQQDMIFGSINAEDGAAVKFLKSVLAIKDDLISLFAGPYKTMIVKGMAKKIKIGPSVVRLNHPSG